ncbi:MAG TPA: GNAT family N-acetyltransferase [Jatrophihabitans sp.]
MKPPLHTERLLIRDWQETDVDAAFAIYGSPEIAHWLTPAMQQVSEPTVMAAILQAWIEAQPNMTPPSGRWAIARRDGDEVVGGLLIRLLPPYDTDLELGWQLRPDAWGNGYATEASRALMRWAFDQGVDELFAVARPNNSRAVATASRLGMQWVGETTKYYDLKLQVYRMRPADLRQTADDVR